MLLCTTHPHLQAVTPSFPSSPVLRWKQRFGYPSGGVSQAHMWAELGPCWGGQHETPSGWFQMTRAMPLNG